MNSDAILKWKQSAEENVKVATDLYNLGHFSWCLFLWHLAIEKSVKAFIAKQDKEVPYIHNLSKLIKFAGLDLSQLNVVESDLDEISGYNIEARYEDYKHDFYLKATKEYADSWIPKCRSIYQLIISQL